MSEPIALVGRACRYPGAASPAELWENVLAMRREFRRIPPERLRLEDYLNVGGPESLYASEAALLDGWEFDRVRFQVAGPTFRSADLAHWLALEVAADALADAGFPEGRGLDREAAGVLVGNTLTGEFMRAGLMRLRWPFVRRMVAARLAEEPGWEPERTAAFLARLEERYKEPFPPSAEESLAGSLSNTIAGRICNHFDLHGGGFTVDGACASSLLAVAQSCSALAAGDLDLALAGGVDLSIDPFELIGFARSGALAADEMRVYDQRSDGFIPGEGCGFVVLMRHADAVASGRRIHALIHGWGISSDGRGGITRPEAVGQRRALDRAYARAGFGIERVGYFEGHGTGTAVGDATELAALSAALRAVGGGSGVSSSLPAIGSIKALIGHTKAAAGAAGLIKATLALEHRILPPHAGTDRRHPELLGENPALRTLDEAEPWPADRPLFAGVSAMGFGGINVHLALGALGAPEPEPERRRALPLRVAKLVASAQDAELIVLTGADAADLAAQARALLPVARRISRAELGDLAGELSAELARDVAEAPATARAALVARRPADLVVLLERLIADLAADRSERIDPRGGLIYSAVRTSPPRIGFLFTGQGAATPRDADALGRRFPEIQEIYDRLASRALPAGLLAQPLISAHSLAGLALLEPLGLCAAVAVGHSLGELTALHWAGALGADDLLRLAAERGTAMVETMATAGGMASIAASAERVGEHLHCLPVVVAAYNAPNRTVISGELAAIEIALSRARAAGLDAQRLDVSHAFHSSLVAGAAPPLATVLADLPFAPLVRQVASTVTGGLLPTEADLPALLLTQLTEPVRFTEALAAAGGDHPIDLWIEIGPGHMLASLAAETLGAPTISLEMGGPSVAGLLTAASAAWALGASVDLSPLFSGCFLRPFDRTRVPRFLANPCELAPLPDTPLPTAEREAVPSSTSPPATLADDPLPPIEVVRALIAERAELPSRTVRDEARLLGDLHLNSITAGQIVAESARRLGLPVPAFPSGYGQATVAEVAAILAESAAAVATGRAVESERFPSGVAAWLRAFRVEWIERPLADRLPPSGHPTAGDSGAVWRVVTVGNPESFGEAIRARLAVEEWSEPGVVLVLPAELDASACTGFLSAARALPFRGPARFVMVQQRGGGGFARTLHLERPEVQTLVVEIDPADPTAPDRVVKEILAQQRSRGHVEARWEGDLRQIRQIRLAPAGQEVAAPSLGPEDVVLVTGGGKGIAAECALALGARTGVKLALLGRSDPGADRELEANLDRFAAAGIVHLYLRADVTDRAAVATAIGQAERTLGPVTALLHGAGTNVPRRIEDLDEAAMGATLAPKVEGLANLLAAVEPERLKLLFAFGSIIGESGLPGEADYALANEWLALRLDRFAREHPACLCRTLAWSVWAGAGMGEKLGRIEALIREGIVPIPVDAGVAAFLDQVTRPTATLDSTVILAGRFGEPPTVDLGRPEPPLLRFFERVRIFVPQVELVVECRLSADSDPYLLDHVFRGERLLPAVVGLEAMAQIATVLLGRDPADPTCLPVFEKVELARPIAVPEGGKRTIRIAALAVAVDTVEIVLRDEATGFAVDHFRAFCRFAADALAEAPALDLPAADEAPPDLDPLVDLYGGILFHNGRFRRVQRYLHLSATSCVAELARGAGVPTFGRNLPDRLLLGDPVLRDGAIHGIQACIPHRTLLPLSIERVIPSRLDGPGPYRLAARERSRQDDTFVYDLELRDESGRLVEQWQGLALRAVDAAPRPAAWRSALAGPWIERNLQELLPGAGLLVEIAPATDGRSALERVVARSSGPAEVAEFFRRADGKPVISAAGSALTVSKADAAQFALVVSVAGGALGCDLELVVARSDDLWRDLLGPERFELARLLARELGEPLDEAATRVWAAGEALLKSGQPPGAPLVLASGASIDSGGWVLLSSGGLGGITVATVIAPLEDPAKRFALAFAGPTATTRPETAPGSGSSSSARTS
ncbi:MAG TPA: type I polyketide synthase [Thermoanaerobaculia bacterium]|jgi:enediyne polyketide synthase|nr:type I polyketide synthase [Thermoanaerobaculia bacterium]